MQRSGNEDGPLHDLPDWHYADGRAAPRTEKQKNWARKRIFERLRIRRLTAEMIELHERAEARDRMLEERSERTYKLKKDFEQQENDKKVKDGSK